MKVKELMIGDIVSYNGSICRVTSTECFGNLVGVENDTICELVSDAELSPIPLTPEILKKNGWQKNGIYNDYILIDDENNFVGYNMSFNSVSITIDDRNALHKMKITANYVHKLQHALRLCGLDELADNLKV